MSDNQPSNQPQKLKPVKVIAISAGKGGVGKTCVAINIALSLASLNKKVLLFDADLGLANVDIMLGLKAHYNLSHVMQGLCSLTDILLTGPHNLHIIPSASGTDYMTQLSATEHAGIIDVFNQLTTEYDYMVIDTAAGISDTVLSFARSSQEIIVVVCNEPTSLTDAYAFIKVMNQRFSWRHFRILTNMVKSHREAGELFNRIYRVAEQFLGVRLDFLGAIPFDEQIHHAIAKQQAVILAYPKAKATKAFQQLAQAIENWPFTYSLNGNTSFFLERLVVENLKKEKVFLKNG